MYLLNSTNNCGTNSNDAIEETRITAVRTGGQNDGSSTSGWDRLTGIGTTQNKQTTAQRHKTTAVRPCPTETPEEGKWGRCPHECLTCCLITAPRLWSQGHGTPSPQIPLNWGDSARSPGSLRKLGPWGRTENWRGKKLAERHRLGDVSRVCSPVCWGVLNNVCEEATGLQRKSHMGLRTAGPETIFRLSNDFLQYQMNGP